MNKQRTRKINNRLVTMSQTKKRERLNKKFKDDKQKLKELLLPVQQFLSDNYHPYISIILNAYRYEFVDTIAVGVNDLVILERDE